jgi:hypothetical protein
LLSYTFQDIEKEVRKQVDEAIAQAKVRTMFCFNFQCSATLFVGRNFFLISLIIHWLFGILKFSMVLMPFFSFQLFLQESPMPDPSELFTNVYVKGLGVEVIKVSFLLDRLSVNQLLFVPRHVFSSRIVLNIKNLSVFYFLFLQFLAFKNL